MPPTDWSKGAKTGFLFIKSVNSLSVHVTHIQFLTLLFPSSLERKLIFVLLGPLAVAAAALNFTQLTSSDVLLDLGDAIRNTCNSSLTLIYTLALFVWGCGLNRTRAWTTEGGTAAFGAVALGLGVVGTAVNFFEVKEERLKWLKGAVSCILLWQSWAGFWWWVGAGMWAGEAEDVERREAKKRRKLDHKRHRETRHATLDHQLNNTDTSLTSLRRRLTPRRGLETAAEPEEIELDDLAHPGSATTGPPGRPAPRSNASNASLSTGSSPPSSHHFYDPVLQLFAPFFLRLRDAHEEAAVARAAEPPGLSEQDQRKWGLRALMLRGRRERGERERQRHGEDDVPDEVDARRAGFQLEGERLGEGEGDGDGWQDDSTDGEREERAFGVRDTTGTGWAWAGWLKRARLRAVDHY